MGYGEARAAAVPGATPRAGLESTFQERDAIPGPRSGGRMDIRPRSIRAKLLLVFLGAAVVPIAVLGVIFYRSAMSAVADMVGNRTEVIARIVRADLDQKLALRIEDRLLATNEPVQS